jgi:hypothetical protein
MARRGEVKRASDGLCTQFRTEEATSVIGRESEWRYGTARLRNDGTTCRWSWPGERRIRGNIHCVQHVEKTVQFADAGRLKTHLRRAIQVEGAVDRMVRGSSSLVGA